MKKDKSIVFKTLATTFCSLGILGLIPNANAQEALFSAKIAPTLLAQSTDCRTVNVNSVLNVREQREGRVIGTLSNGQDVYITRIFDDGWVQIQSPVNGYIVAKYLTYCSDNISTSLSQGETTSTVPESNCRQVNRHNLPVRKKPLGTIVGQLNKDQKVMIANEGYDGWIPIEQPMSGYIPSQYLTDCDGEPYPISSTGESISTVAGGNCRQILAPDVPLRQKPKGSVIGTLQQNQRVYIANEGINGWVAIEKPVSGFVTSPNLGKCTP